MLEKCFQYSTRSISFNNQDMILVIVDDITDTEKQRKALAEKNRHLEELYKQRNELMGIAAHDLRNPLSVINSFSEIMLETFEEHEAERIKELIKIIFKTSGFTLQLLNDILDFSKIESGTLDLKKHQLNYVQFVKENLAQNEFFSVQKNIKIHLNAPETNLIYSFDPRRIEQVMNNLLGNAIKYSFPGRDIEVTISSDEEFVITSIKDYGQGIPEKDLPHIFKPFQQVSVKPTHNEKSTGLGLAIVKKIIDFHQGSISVSSKPGDGSTFSFYLPLR
jgi:signal transduction histidine kinase